jgi:predicted transport protein
MTTLTPHEPESEKELHGIIQRELEALEAGMRLLKYEMPLSVGIPDFLCVDSGGRLVIIEVKLHEDENILFQALGYFTEVDRARYVLAESFKDFQIDPKQSPRILLIAEGFSDYVRRLSTLVKPKVELYGYSAVRLQNREIGIVFHETSLPQDEVSIPEVYQPDQFRDYITDERLRILFDEFRRRIKQTDPSIEEYSTSNYVGFKYRGRNIAGLQSQRKSFDFWSSILADNCSLQTYDSIRIKTGQEDVTSNFQSIRESIGKIVAKYDSP